MHCISLANKALNPETQVVLVYSPEFLFHYQPSSTSVVLLFFMLVLLHCNSGILMTLVGACLSKSQGPLDLPVNFDFLCCWATRAASSHARGVHLQKHKKQQHKFVLEKFLVSNFGTWLHIHHKPHMYSSGCTLGMWNPKGACCSKYFRICL